MYPFVYKKARLLAFYLFFLLNMSVPFSKAFCCILVLQKNPDSSPESGLLHRTLSLLQNIVTYGNIAPCAKASHYTDAAYSRGKSSSI